MSSSRIEVNIEPRLYQVPLGGAALGCAIGIMRGGRAASLRFLAENAHRPPTTVQGWYFYKKTKNYRVMLGALQGAAKESARIGGLSLVFVGLEEGIRRAGAETFAEVGAGLGTAAVFGGLFGRISDRAGWKRMVVLGIGMGAGLKLLKEARGRIE
ncbi:hypothetical protein FA15DRAFT_238027 [Coprinopsis marcescibilis]|uniref:Mitochondrial import inner membrane translocase subunit TIM22 n=1 Tax=Coprinopsis marcescibilis TaxID=230819 RepID=A0A5C3L2S0_COPMA|nr:hypothetical protein FA15DRAFT_238027 [Coprinopsis marcescibilis]